MNSFCLLVIILLGSCILESGAVNQEPYAICLKCTPSTNCTQVSLKGDWLLLYSSDIRTRKGSSYWGGDFPYDFCDAFNLNSGCMAVGYSVLAGNASTQIGYSYSFNAFTDVWTIQQVTNEMYIVPGTQLKGFRTTYNHYVQVENAVAFSNGSPVACGTKVLRSGPIYRSASFVILANAPDFSWVVFLYCDNFYGLIDHSAPLIQVLVKKDIIDKTSYPFNTLFFYNEIKTALIKNNLNVYASDFKLIYHDDKGVYPVATHWESIQWEADCVCKSGEIITKSE